MSIVKLAPDAEINRGDFWVNGGASASNEQFVGQMSSEGDLVLGIGDVTTRFREFRFTSGDFTFRYLGTWETNVSGGALAATTSASGRYDKIVIERNGEFYASLALDEALVVDFGSRSDISVVGLNVSDLVAPLLSLLLGDTTEGAIENLHLLATPNLPDIADVDADSAVTVGTPGGDVITGDDTDETVDSGDGGDQVSGGGGDDRLDGGGGNDTIRGGDGADRLSGGEGADAIAGDDGDDSLFGGAGNDRVNGGAGNDMMRGGQGNDILRGGTGVDVIFGEDGSDRIFGEDGADRISGGRGNDKASGGDGNDIIRGGTGNDVLRGGAGNDRLLGEDGNDRLLGGDGNDRLVGGDGKDFIAGGAGNDVLLGGREGDRMLGGIGNDRMIGSGGDDLMIGRADSDILFGGDGQDRLAGDGGNDRLLGNAGEDLLRGGAGKDLLVGGEGGDTLFGGRGADVFIFAKSDHSSSTPQGRDAIEDFSRPQGDRIGLRAIDADTTQQGNQGFNFIGDDRFSKDAGELRFQKQGGDTLITADRDGDGKADFSILVDGPVAFQAGDFLL